MKSIAMNLLLMLALMTRVSGCGKSAELTPPDIHFGQDTCHACGMILEDERYASAVVVATPDEQTQTFLFDDPGEMLAFTPPASASQTVWYVRDAGTKKWLDATKATFVQADKLQTPMGSGIAAYATKEPAATAAQTLNGNTATFEQLHSNPKR